MALPTLVLPLRNQAAVCRSLWPPSHPGHARNRRILAHWAAGKAIAAIADEEQCTSFVVSSVLRRIRRTSGALPCKPNHSLIEFCQLVFDGPEQQQWGERLEKVRRWCRNGVPYTAQALLLEVDPRDLRTVVKRAQLRCVNRLFPDEDQLTSDGDYAVQRWQLHAGWPTDPTSPYACYLREQLRRYPRLQRGATVGWSPHRTLEDHLRCCCWQQGTGLSDTTISQLARAHRQWMRSVPLNGIALDLGLPTARLRVLIQRVQRETQNQFFPARSVALDHPSPRPRPRPAPAMAAVPDQLAELREQVATYRVMWRNGWDEAAIARDLQVSTAKVATVITELRARKGWFVPNRGRKGPRKKRRSKSRKKATAAPTKIDDPRIAGIAAYRPMWRHGWREAEIARDCGHGLELVTAAVAKLRRTRGWFPVEG